MRDFGLVPAKEMPPVDIILIEVPDEVGGYGAKGVGEIGCVATAGAVAAALHSYDGIRRFRLPMEDSRQRPGCCRRPESESGDAPYTTLTRLRVVTRLGLGYGSSPDSDSDIIIPVPPSDRGP